MADHSQKWHDDTTSRNIGSSSSKDGLAALVNKLDNLGRDMKKLKESVHAIQVGCQICEGPYLDKDCPLNEEVKQVEEVRYEEYERTTPSKGNNEGRQTLAETEIRQSDEYPKFMKDLVANKPLTLGNEDIKINRRLLNQLPPKDKDPGSFILPCSIGRLEFNNALADLRAGINIMPFSMYKRLGIGKLETIKMNIELADNSKCIPKWIVRNLLVKIDKFILPIDFIILDVLEDFRIPVILGRPLLTTAHAKVNVLKRSISLEVRNEKVIFKLKNDLYDVKNESFLMIQSNIITEEDELMNIESDLFTYNTNTCESCLILAVDTDLFTYEVVTHETYEEITHKFDYDDIDDFYDPDQCEESRNNEIRERIIHNLHEEWFKGTSDDEDDIEGIIDYLQPTSYDGIQKPRGNFRDQVDSYSFGNFAEIAAVRA
ncbi:zinc knuckle CX2CX4HX4C containing protein [Tanacetum coccineum]